MFNLKPTADIRPEQLLVDAVRIKYLVVGNRSLASPTAAPLLGPSWLAGRGLGCAVGVGGRRASTFSTTVRGSRVRGRSGSILRSLLLTEYKKKKFIKKLSGSKTWSCSKIFYGYELINLLDSLP